MSNAMLDRLSSELFECVVQFLELPDICNLRLANRITAYKTNQDRYRSFFRTRTVETTRSDLQAFSHVTTGDGLGCLVEDLTFLGVVYSLEDLERTATTGTKVIRERERKSAPVAVDQLEVSQAQDHLAALKQRQADDHELRENGADFELLKQAFANIAASDRKRSLRLGLEIVGYGGNATSCHMPREDNRSDMILRRASKTFETTVTALCESPLSLSEFGVFHGNTAWLGSSLTIDAFTTIDWLSTNLRCSIETLQCLSMRLCDSLLDTTMMDDDQIINGYEKRYTNLLTLLYTCKNLQDLTISWYDITKPGDKLRDLQYTLHSKMINQIAEMPCIPSLRKVHFGGLRIKDTSGLLAFLRRHSDIQEYSLNYISIGSGDLSPVIRYISSDASNLKAVHLEDIYEGYRIVHFAGEMDQPFTKIYGGYLHRNVIDRWDEDIKKQVAYYSYIGMALAMGTPSVLRWRERKVDEFGS